MEKALTIPQKTELSIPVSLMGEFQKALALRVQAGEMSQATQAAYVRGFGKFLEWCQAEQIEQVGKDEIRRWMADLLSQGKRPNTVNAWLSATRAFFSWAVNEGRLLSNPVEGIRGTKRKGTSGHHLRAMLTDQEVKRVLAKPDNSPQGVRDRAILSVMAYTGARSVEIHRADLSNLSSDNERLVLHVQGKGHAEADEVIVIANPAAENALYDWLAVRGDKVGPLFTSLSNRCHGGRISLSAIRHLVKNYYRAAGVVGERKTTHSLRHTAISNAIRHGAPPQKVKSMARHESLDTTMIYFHELDRIDNPAEAFIDYGET